MDSSLEGSDKFVFGGEGGQRVVEVIKVGVMYY